MKRVVLVFCVLLIGFSAFAQPTNYSWYKQRTRQYSFMADSAMYLPRYNGTPSGVRSAESSTISGMVGIDTTNHRQYFRSGSSWRRLANYTELGVDSIWRVAGTDSIYYSKQGTTYKIKDSTGGGSTPTLQQVLTAGSTLTGNNNIVFDGFILNFKDNNSRSYLSLDGAADHKSLIIDVDDADSLYAGASFTAYPGSNSWVVEGSNDIGVFSREIITSGDITSGELNILSRFSNISEYESIIKVNADSILLKPHQARLNIDSLRTWSAVADTTYKKPMTWDTRNGRWEYASNWFGGGSSSVALSSITAATASNTINNGDYKQRWQWNTLSGANGLSIESTSTDAAGNQQELVGIRLSGANSQLGQTTKSLVVSNAHTGSGSENYAVDITASGASSANYGVRVTATGTASNNYGLFVSASGGTNNYSLITAEGNVGIGTSTPSELLSVGASGSTKGVISLAGNTSGKVIIQPAAAAGTYTLTLPTTDGNSGEFLQTDGSGVLTWAAAAGGGITVGTTTITSGTSGRVAYNNAGVYGEKAVTGTGDVVLATSPTITTGYYVNDGANKLQVATNFYGADFISKSVRFQSSGNTYLKYTSNDESATDPAVTVNTIVTGKPGIKILLTGSQTADAFYVENSGGNKLMDVTANGVLDLYNYGTAPTASVTNGIRLYAEDVSSSAELKVRDEAGNITTLSPHNFSKIPGGKSEEMAWSFYSEKDGQYINVDMLKLARLVEKLTGEKLVYTGKK